jgi:hypothetical protein
MRHRRGGVGQMRLGCVCSGAFERARRSKRASPFVVLVGLALVWVVGLVGAAGAAADLCPNAALRSGASAGLPDCRAYELVTPANKGRTQALGFTEGSSDAIVSGDGDRVALKTIVPLGPNPSLGGARAVFSRTSSGWMMDSAVEPGASGRVMEMRLFSPDLSQVAFESEEAGLNFGEKAEDVALEAGPVGGPYAPVASIPRAEVESLNTQLLGASEDLGDVLFASTDHELPLPGVEGAAAKTTDSGALDLYDWSGGHLQLVNFKKDGSLISQCGATLGAGGGREPRSTTVNAVSGDGSTIFFTVPGTTGASSGPGCEEPTRLFMRVNGGEPVEVSAPEPGVTPSEALAIRYNYATQDGSKVFFNTGMALTSDDSSKANKLYEYDTEAPEGKRLRRIASGVPATSGVGLAQRQGFYFSEDGSVVYVESENGTGELQEISRYDTNTGKDTFVADAYSQKGSFEPSYTTPNGEFFLFTSKSLVTPSEPDGSGSQHGGTGPDEMYRYDHADGSVICVTCGPGKAPSQGETIGAGIGTVLETEDKIPAMAQISEDGQEVFFQTTAQLVPQDTNSTRTEESSAGGFPGLDVYEWEAEGSEEAPGVFCGDVNGCTHLLSSGEDVGPARLLGASANGSNVFFESAARLVPQDTDEFPDIYDARVDGGFVPPQLPLECLSCQGVGSPPPLFNVPASVSFTGAGNSATRVIGEKLKPRRKRPKGGHRKPRRGKKPKTADHHGGFVLVSRRGS